MPTVCALNLLYRYISSKYALKRLHKNVYILKIKAIIGLMRYRIQKAIKIFINEQKSFKKYYTFL